MPLFAAKMTSSTSNSIMDIREIMDLLEQTYPYSTTTSVANATNGCGAVVEGKGKERWAKTRRYLYQYRASCINTLQSQPPSPTQQSSAISNRSRRREPLKLVHVQRILSFLSYTFPNSPHLQAKIIQESPRILGQYRSIDSKLIPTVEFLKKLYGHMDVNAGGGNEDGIGGSNNIGATAAGDDFNGRGMFYEAISRNTDLLLVRGVGYAGGIDNSDGRIDVNDGTNGSSTVNSNNIMEIEEYLRDELGITSRAIISKLKEDHPTLFQSSLNGRVRPVVQYLHSLLGNGNDYEYNVLNAGTTISALGEESLPVISPQSKVTKRVAKIVTTHPMLLQLDVQSNLLPTVQFLANYCDFTHEELAHVISAAPGILGLSVERNLRATIEILEDILKGDTVGRRGEDISEEISKSLLGKSILKHPQILALSLDNLCAKRDYFNGIDSYGKGSAVDDVERPDRKKITLASRILVSAPSAYSLSLSNNIKPKVEFLAKLWGDNIAPASFNEEGTHKSTNIVADNLCEYPQILTLSKEGNIIPTLSFYNMTGYVRLDSSGLPVDMPQPTFSIRSRYIATSLYNRLLPRWHFLLREQENRQLLELGMDEEMISSMTIESLPKYILPSTSIATKDVMLPPLHLLAGASDEVFCRQMKLSLEEYLDFKEEAVPRLKFSSQFDRWLKTGRPID